jgi:hypothetical protein
LRHACQFELELIPLRHACRVGLPLIPLWHASQVGLPLIPLRHACRVGLPLIPLWHACRVGLPLIPLRHACRVGLPLIPLWHASRVGLQLIPLWHACRVGLPLIPLWHACRVGLPLIPLRHACRVGLPLIPLRHALPPCGIIASTAPAAIPTDKVLTSGAPWDPSCLNDEFTCDELDVTSASRDPNNPNLRACPPFRSGDGESPVSSPILMSASGVSGIDNESPLLKLPQFRSNELLGFTFIRDIFSDSVMGSHLHLQPSLDLLPRFPLLLPYLFMLLTILLYHPSLFNGGSRHAAVTLVVERFLYFTISCGAFFYSMTLSSAFSLHDPDICLLTPLSIADPSANPSGSMIHHLFNVATSMANHTKFFFRTFPILGSVSISACNGYPF